MTNYNQLNLSQRETIQILFNKVKSFTDIGIAIGKDRTTIFKEIKKNRYIKNNFYDAFDKNGINKAIDSCNKLQSNYVCNTCPNEGTCNKHHLFYDYRLAQKHYEEQLVNSRTGVDIKPDEIDKIEKQIVPLIKNNKQSVNQVFFNHPDILFFSKTTFYKYVDIGVLSLTNSDLLKKSDIKKEKVLKTKIINAKYLY